MDLACDCSDTGARRSADQGALQPAAKYRSKDGTAGPPDERAFSRPNSTLVLVLILLIAVLPIVVLLIAVTLIVILAIFVSTRVISATVVTVSVSSIVALIVARPTTTLPHSVVEVVVTMFVLRHRVPKNQERNGEYREAEASWFAVEHGEILRNPPKQAIRRPRRAILHWMPLSLPGHRPPENRGFAEPVRKPQHLKSCHGGG
jgi:hypothetical protein